MGGKSDVSTVTSFKFLIMDLHDSAFSTKTTPSKTYQAKNYNTPIAIDHGSSSLSHQAATPSNLWKHEEQQHWSYNDLASWARVEFGLHKSPGKSTIKRILGEKELLSQLSADCLAKKRLRSPHMLRLDEALVGEIICAELAKMPLSGCLKMAMARKFACDLNIPKQYRPRFTRNGWLRHFLARYDLRLKRAHGEIGSVDVESAKKHLNDLRDQIKQFHPSDVFNMDETALFYKAVPRTAVVLKEAPALKQDKSRVIMVVGANADGTYKLPLVFLGKAENPRWLAEKPDGVQYIGTSKGWMTVQVYQEWLEELDQRMGAEGRKVLLLVDNAPVHIDRGVCLQNITILKLPPNITALLQPMDQGVIAYLKHAYMNLKTDTALENFFDGDENPYQASLLDGIEWCQESWCSVPADVIKNCWRHAGLFVDRSQVESILSK